jgi:flagellar assembly factor FliW
MSTLTFESSRFGTVEIASDAVIEFPSGLIGLGGSRYALVSADTDGAFHWLHSLEDASLALPVTNPWLFFSDYEVELSDADTDRVGCERPDVWVTVRTGSAPEDFSANLRAPIVIAEGRGHQVINEASDAPVRAPLFAGDAVEAAA